MASARASLLQIDFLEGSLTPAVLFMRGFYLRNHAGKSDFTDLPRAAGLSKSINSADSFQRAASQRLQKRQ